MRPARRRQCLRVIVGGAKPHPRNAKKLEAWYLGSEDEVVRLQRENAELRKALADCEAKLREP